MPKTLPFVLVFMLVLGLGGCAGRAPVPGGNENVNAKYYKTGDDFKERVERLQAGMSEELALSILGRKKEDLTRMPRVEIVTALYGLNTMQMINSAEEREQTRAYLETLYGYKIQFSDVKSHIGFTSPIRIRTDKDGVSYSTNLIFRNGALLEKPELTGGVVHDSRSKTFFDYLNPGTFMGAVN